MRTVDANPFCHTYHRFAFDFSGILIAQSGMDYCHHAVDGMSDTLQHSVELARESFVRQKCLGEDKAKDFCRETMQNINTFKKLNP